MVIPGMDFCVGLKSATLFMEISTPSVERTLLEKRQLWAPGSGTTPGSTGLPRAAAASAVVISEQASSVFRAPPVGVAEAPAAVCDAGACDAPVCVPPAGVPLP